MTAPSRSGTIVLPPTTAISDYDVHSPEEGGLRHGLRIASLAEKPVGVNGLESVW